MKHQRTRNKNGKKHNPYWQLDTTNPQVSHQYFHGQQTLEVHDERNDNKKFQTKKKARTLHRASSVLA